MKLLIKQRILSLRDTYDIYDEFGTPKYLVKAELVALEHRLHIYDMYKNEIGQINEKLFTLTPAFNIIVDGQLYGKIQRKISLLKPKYDIDFNGWHIEGDLIRYNYTVFASGNPIIHVSKKPLAWGDTYVIDFENPRDELMGVLLVVAIDAANCSRRKH